MTPAEIAEINRIESDEIEGEIRAEHRPINHGLAYCPTGSCCSCMTQGGCHAGQLIVLLDAARGETARLRQPWWKRMFR